MLVSERSFLLTAAGQFRNSTGIPFSDKPRVFAAWLTTESRTDYIVSFARNQPQHIAVVWKMPHKSAPRRKERHCIDEFGGSKGIYALEKIVRKGRL